MKNWFAKLLGGISLTTAMFIFEACYGMPQNMGYDVLVEGQIVSKVTGLPIEGVAVSGSDTSAYQLTDSLGKFSFYTVSHGNGIDVSVRDIDSTLNLNFKRLDTFIVSQDKKLNLILKLEEK